MWHVEGYDVARCGAPRDDAASYDVARFGAIRYTKARYGSYVVRCGTLRYGMMHYSTIQHSTG